MKTSHRKQLDRLLSTKNRSLLDKKLVQSLTDNEPEPLETYITRNMLYHFYNTTNSKFKIYCYNFNNIMMNICSIKNTFNKNFILESFIHVCCNPLVHLTTKDNFLILLDTILDKKQTSLLDFTENYNIYADLDDKRNHPYYKLEKYVVVVYLGFALYPETQTVEMINKYRDIVLMYATIREYLREQINTRYSENNLEIVKNCDMCTLIYEITALIKNIDPSNVFILFDTVTYIIYKQDDILSFIFSNDTEITPEFIDNAFNSTNYKAVEYVLDNGVIPTTINFDAIIDNNIMNGIVSRYDNKYGIIDDGTYCKCIKIATYNIDQQVNKLLTYKILPTDKFINIIESIVDNLNILKQNAILKNYTGIISCINIIHSTICCTVSKLIEYNYPLSNAIYYILILKKNSIFVRDIVSEEFYYNMYKFHILTIINAPIENFVNPVHKMRHMCLDKKTTVNVFKKYIKQQKIKPDRYCFEYASLYNKKIAEWLFKNGCLPTIKSTIKSLHISDIKRTIIDEKYFVKLVNTVQTQQYMCEQYSYLVV